MSNNIINNNKIEIINIYLQNNITIMGNNIPSRSRNSNKICIDLETEHYKKMMSKFISKFRHTLDEYYPQGHEIYKRWGNFYKWRETLELLEKQDKSDNTYIDNPEFNFIFSDDKYNNSNIKLSFIYDDSYTKYKNRDYIYCYFKFEYDKYCWGHDFSTSVCVKNFKYIVDTVDSFDACIKYLENEGFTSASILKNLKNLITCEYYEKYK